MHEVTSGSTAGGLRDHVCCNPRRTVPGGAALAELVASGQAELALNQVQDLVNRPGVELVGPFPIELQNIVTFAAAQFRGGNREPGAALIQFLRTPDSVAVIKAKGMDPP